jgi:hypothetical protein
MKASGQQQRVFLRRKNGWIKIHSSIVLECRDRDNATGFGLLKSDRCIRFLR